MQGDFARVQKLEAQIPKKLKKVMFYSRNLFFPELITCTRQMQFSQWWRNFSERSANDFCLKSKSDNYSKLSSQNQFPSEMSFVHLVSSFDSTVKVNCRQSERKNFRSKTENEKNQLQNLQKKHSIKIVLWTRRMQS